MLLTRSIPVPPTFPSVGRGWTGNDTMERVIRSETYVKPSEWMPDRLDTTINDGDYDPVRQIEGDIRSFPVRSLHIVTLTVNHWLCLTTTEGIRHPDNEWISISLPSLGAPLSHTTCNTWKWSYPHILETARVSELLSHALSIPPGAPTFPAITTWRTGWKGYEGATNEGFHW